MADEDKEKKGLEGGKEKDTIEVPAQVLADIQEKMAKMEQDLENEKLKNIGIAEMLDKGPNPEGEQKLRTKKNFEPKFRTVRLRKYPIMGDNDNLGYVVGWTSRGAYQKVDDTGINKQYVDFIEVIFLGYEKDEKGKLKAEKIKLLDLMNFGIQVNCKILETEKKTIDVPTNEEIAVQSFDPQHGLVSTGEIIDGYTSYSEIKYKLQIPGIEQPVWVDSLYCN